VGRRARPVRARSRERHPDDRPDRHNFTQQDVNTLFGVVEPDDPSTSSAAATASVDPTPEAERAARIEKVMAELVAAGADPDGVRFLAAQAWHAGWVTGWDERGDAHRGVSRNPYDSEPAPS
jgi:hypothetical protein